jgi:hypothetical protein
MEVVSGQLSENQILEEVPEIVKLLGRSGLEDVLVEYGWGSRTDTDKLWLDIELQLRELQTFVETSVKEGIFLPGKSDLIIQDKLKTVKFTLCHESDIHLLSDDQPILDLTVRHWREKGYRGFKRANSGNWIPIS